MAKLCFRIMRQLRSAICFIGRLFVYTNANDDEPLSTFSSTTRQLNLAIGAAQAIGMSELTVLKELTESFLTETDRDRFCGILLAKFLFKNILFAP